MLSYISATKQVEFEIKNNIYINAPKYKMLSYKAEKKYVQDLYEDNYKTLMKEIRRTK